MAEMKQWIVCKIGNLSKCVVALSSHCGTFATETFDEGSIGATGVTSALRWGSTSYALVVVTENNDRKVTLGNTAHHQLVGPQGEPCTNVQIDFSTGQITYNLEEETPPAE